MSKEIDIRILVKRFIAFHVDFYLMGFIAGIPYSIAPEEVTRDVSKFAFPFLICVLYVVYSSIMEKKSGATIGKKLLKLRVKSNEDSRFFLRNLFKIIPLDAISFLMTPDRKFWHDRLSNTDVEEY